MEDAGTRMEAEKENAEATRAQTGGLRSRAECFDAADLGTGRQTAVRLTERV